MEKMNTSEKKDTKSAVERLAERAEKSEKLAPQISDAKALSIRERLLKRKKNAIHNIKISDGDEEFYIPIHVLDQKEQQEIIALQIRLAGYRNLEKEQKTKEEMEKTIEDGRKLIDQFYKWVARVCVDPELDEEYWKRGVGFTTDIPIMIIREAVEASRKSTEDLISFRKK